MDKEIEVNKYFSKEKSRRVNVERYVATVNRLRAWDCYVE